MAKKLNAKEKRLLSQQAQKDKYKKMEEERQAAEQARLAEEARQKAETERKKKEALEKEAREKLEKELLEKNPSLKKVKKSKAKAAGLKSTFAIGNELLMTSFGKGNEAVPEHYIFENGMISMQNPPAFDVENRGTSFSIAGKNAMNAIADDPRRTSKKVIGEDLIGAKSALEKRYFGKTFEDNIHIQLIYNILDIEKILSKHINNIVFSINNIRGIADPERDDLIGYMSLRDSYEYFMDEKNEKRKVLRESYRKLFKSSRLSYFGSAFYVEKQSTQKKKSGQKNFELRNEKDCYYMLALLGELRQVLAHSSAQKQGKEQTEARSSVYNLRTVGNNDMRKILNSLYAERVDALNENFMNYAKKDLTILFGIMDASSYEKKAEIARDFYDFTVRKSYKNIGFSIKKIRERMMDCFFANVKEITPDSPDFQSVRQKFYKILDFLLFTYYKDNKEETKKIIAALRASLTELEKELFYQKQANILWNKMQMVVTEQIYPRTKGSAIQNLIADPEISADMLKGVMITPESVDYFSKMIYLLTLFIDGKEINDLLTTMINKFENIASFVSVLKDRGLPCNFRNDYSVFNNALKISAELREINSFARMEKATPGAKKQMFLDAAIILGSNESAEELSEYFDEMLDKQKGKRTPGGKKDMGFRNFLIKNVIESDRFHYLIRYGHPLHIRKLAENKNVIAFVLKQIPEPQIDRYCKICALPAESNFAQKILRLTDLIAEMNFRQFENVRQTEKNEQKQILQGILSLYLTVLYLLTKNLVYVNSRYFLAFHCLERDTELLGSQAGHKNAEKQLIASYSALTQQFLDEGKLNRHAREYLTVNIQNSDDWTIAQYRNNAAHLNAIRNAHLYIREMKSVRSYFELYHYLTQRALLDKYENVPYHPQVNEKTLKYFELLKENGWYCKDFVKALNVPFGYNLPRYKNLSIDALFDKDRPQEEDENHLYTCQNIKKS